MSKKISARITCRSCKNDHDYDLFRSLWIEHKQNRNMVFDDKVNLFICPSCSHSEQLAFPFLVSNTKKKFAVWYEPKHDPQIDKDIEQYAQHMGENSYYAKAPRISDWNDFKKKILELETVQSTDSNDEFSDEMMEHFSGFINEFPTKLKTNNYPKYICHLQTIRGRIFYSVLTFILLCLFAYINNPDFTANVKSKPSKFGLVFLSTIGISFAIFTLIHMVVGLHSQWNENRAIRLWCFGTLYWVIGVFLYVVLLDPYQNGTWSYMDDNEWRHMFLFMLSPPVFLGSAIYIYKKYIQ